MSETREYGELERPIREAVDFAGRFLGWLSTEEHDTPSRAFLVGSVAVTIAWCRDHGVQFQRVVDEVEAGFPFRALGSERKAEPARNDSGRPPKDSKDSNV